MDALIFVLLLYLVTVSSDSFSVPVTNNDLHESEDVISVPAGMSPMLTNSIFKGTEMAWKHCQTVFKWDKWNCPRSSFLRVQKQELHKEAALSQSLLMAGIVHQITRDCSKGKLTKCGCDINLGPPSVVTSNSIKFKKLLHNFTQNVDENSGEWTWGGCSDDPTYALKVMRKLIKNMEKENDVVAYVELHNSKLGGQIVRESMMKKCRCHGVSGSCSMKTCWVQVAPFGELTKKLREKYKTAERLSYEIIKKAVSLGNSARELPKKKEIPARPSSLVYLVQSPDYCVANTTKGFDGMKGRRCSRNTSNYTSPSEKKSCRTLCRECGYRVKRIQRQETRLCNCKFIWCCKVECDNCVIDIQEYFCD